MSVFPSQVPAGVLRDNEGERHPVIGHTITFKSPARETNGANFFFEVRSPAGTLVPPHIHHVEDEYIYVIEGELDVLIGNTMYKAGAGDLIKMPRGVPHGIFNNGGSTAKSFWSVIPAGKMESLFQTLGSLPANQPPDPVKIGKIFADHDLELLPPPPQKGL